MYGCNFIVFFVVIFPPCFSFFSPSTSSDLEPIKSYFIRVESSSCFFPPTAKSQRDAARLVPTGVFLSFPFTPLVCLSGVAFIYSLVCRKDRQLRSETGQHEINRKRRPFFYTRSNIVNGSQLINTTVCVFFFFLHQVHHYYCVNQLKNKHKTKTNEQNY